MYLWDIDFDITEPKPVYDVNDEIKIELAGIDSGLKPKRCITFWKYVQQIWYLSPMLPPPKKKTIINMITIIKDENDYK